MSCFRPYVIFIALFIFTGSCGSDSNSSSSSNDKHYYCQTSSEATGGYTLIMCREYLNLSKSQKSKVIAACDADDTGDFREEQQCPDTEERLGGCAAEEDGLDLTLYFYKDYTSNEASNACSNDYDGEWSTALHKAPLLPKIAAQ